MLSFSERARIGTWTRTAEAWRGVLAALKPVEAFLRIQCRGHCHAGSDLRLLSRLKANAQHSSGLDEIVDQARRDALHGASWMTAVNAFSARGAASGNQ